MTPAPTTELETIIGLEVHLQFCTRTKIFCGCINAFTHEPNTHTCPVCQGLPGTLPVLNKTALDYAVKVALGLNCTVNSLIKFDRKNYYYPDLPKGYQISQYDFPIGHSGSIMISCGGEKKNIRIHRAHLEEDAGKLIHDPQTKSSLVDYNRTGTPLMEIVTEPDLRSPQEAYDYLTTLKLILQYLRVSDCDMEKGSLRCDANISIRKKGDPKLGTKSELKNMNSFKAVKAALEYEEQRQTQAFLAGETLVQETRLWNEEKGITLAMRTKEESHDYRYFPEPDLVPFVLESSEIAAIRATLPEMPEQRAVRFQADYGLTDYDAGVLISDPDLADFFESCLKHFDQAKKVCNWITGALMSEMNARKTGLPDLSLKPSDLTVLIRNVEEGTLSNLAGKEVLKTMLDTRRPCDEIIKEKGLVQISDDSALETVIEEILKENPRVVEQIQEGKANAVGFLVGQAMKKTQGKANPKKIQELLKRRLSHG